MFCSKCGKEVAEGALYCSNSGVRIEEACEKTEVENTAQTNAETENYANNEIVWNEMKSLGKKYYLLLW